MCAGEQGTGKVQLFAAQNLIIKFFPFHNTEVQKGT